MKQSSWLNAFQPKNPADLLMEYYPQSQRHSARKVTDTQKKLLLISNRIRQVTVYQVATSAMISLVGLFLIFLSIEIHRGFNTSAFDFGLYDQGVWLISRFRRPFVTLMGRNLIGDHTSFVLLAIVPLYWIFGSTSTLFVVQSVVIVSGAIPVYLYANKCLRSEAMATVFAGVYLLHPATIWIGLENFHPDSFLGLFVGVAIYCASQRKWWLYSLAVILSLSVKEDVALVLVPLGIWVAARRHLKIGIFTSVGSLWYLFLAMFGIQGGINGELGRNSWRIPFGGWVGVIRELFTNPFGFFGYLVGDGRAYYLLQLFLPVAMVFAIAPEVAGIGALVVLANILSSFWYQYHIEYHYSFVVVPILVMGTIFAVNRISQKYRRLVVGLVAVTSLFSAWMWTPIPLGRTEISYNSSSHEMVKAAQQALDKVPKNAVVSAYHPLTAHLARRDRIYVFPVPFRRALYGLDVFASGDVLDFVDEIEYVVLPISMDETMTQVWSEVSDSFQITYANSWFVVYQRILE